MGEGREEGRKGCGGNGGFLCGSLRLCVRFLREGGGDSLPAALCEAKLAGPLPLIKGDSYLILDSRARRGKPGL